jgi:peptide/nickel transport system ATP-binding protein
LSSTLKLGEEKDRLEIIEGTVPDLSKLPLGCLFNPRCSQAKTICSNEIPGTVEIEKGHVMACHL